MEAKLEAGTGERGALLDELYALRNNIHAVRKRLLAQRSRPMEGPTN